MIFDVNEYENPFEQLDWRWLRVQTLLKDDEQPNRKDDDKYTWKCYRFLRELQNTRTDSERYCVTLHHRTVADAYSWYKNHTNKRQFIEALLLCSDVNNKDIAEYLGIKEEVVFTYGKLFFDVMDKITNKGFLCSKILKPAVMDALHTYSSPTASWKLCAIFGGFNVVKACWEYGEHDKSVLEFHQKAGLAHLMRNFGVGNYFRKANQYTMPEITGEVMHMLELEIKRNEAEGGSHVVRQRASLIAELLTTAKFTMINGPEDTDMSPDEPRLFEKLMLPAMAGKGA